MVDHATPDLPARDLPATSRFYAALGFGEACRDEGWLVLSRGGAVLEFFPDPGVDPASSGASWPRVDPLRLEPSGLRIGALVDLDGTLLRVVQNQAAG